MSAPPGGLSYARAVQALQERGRFGVRLGLGRTRALLAGLGNPERTVRGALVGGTNGKGSVLALADSVLRAAGYRVGTTPKPHLVSYRERVQVDGRPIDAADFSRLVGGVLAMSDEIAPRHGQPTEFELLTAVAFARFAEVRPQVALVEVGLGGRLDATHAWNGGVAVVTNVDLDHTEWLGDTVTAIAREKAAIIERGDLAVTGAHGDALAVIRRRARRLGVHLAEPPPAPLIGWDRDGIEVELPGMGRTRVGLRGRHQAANVAITDALLDALEMAGIARASVAERRDGYATAAWPGRLELLRIDGRDVLLDGAHNPAGAAALAVAIDDLRPFLDDGPITLLTASMADKDVDAVIAALVVAPALARATVVCTSLALPRAMGAPELAARWRAQRPDGRIVAETDPIAALDRVLEKRAFADGPVVVAGSLYLVGAARGQLVDDPDLRDPVPSEEA